MKPINLHITDIFRAIFLLTTVVILNTAQEDRSRQRLKVNYVWIVDQLHFHSVESPLFSASRDDTVKWYLRLEPNVGEDEKYFNLYLRLSPNSKESGIDITLDLRIWNDERRAESKWNYGFSYPRHINVNTQDYGATNVLKESRILFNNKMIISCDLTYWGYAQNITTPMTTFQPSTTNNKFFDNLASLFQNETFSDIVLIVNGTKYPAHKTILVAQSPVFAAMFESSSRKGKTLKRLNITNMNERVAVEMLRYIYTGKCENLQNISHQLLAAADKYGIDTLKTICAETLGQNLAVENAAKILALANKHGTAELKAKTIEFIASKYIEVSNTTDWKRVKKNSELVDEVCKRQHVLLDDARRKLTL